MGGYATKVIYIVAVFQQVAYLLRDHTSSAFVTESSTFQYRYRESLISTALFRPSFRCTTISSTRIHSNSKPEEYDDGIGDITNRKSSSSNDTSYSDGEALAAEFYKSIKERKDKNADVDADINADTDNNGSPSNKNKAAKDSLLTDRGESPSSISPPSTRRREAGSLFESNDYYDNEENIAAPKPTLKYTGRPNDDNNYFGSSTGNTNNNVREEMMRREFQLVSGATGPGALGLQAGLALFMLVFFIYIGASGGIVTGEAAVNMDFGGGDDIQFEQQIPVPRDSENSVWI